MIQVARRLFPLETPRLIDFILDFAETSTKYMRGDVGLYLYQKLFARRIIESVVNNEGETITGLFSRQAGKTQTVADVSVSLAIILPTLAKQYVEDPRFHTYRTGFRVGIFAPILEQAGFSFRRIRAFITSASGLELMKEPSIDIELIRERGDELTWDNNSVIRAKSASPDTHVEGATYDLIIIDEAQDVLRSKVEKEIAPMLTATAGTMVKIGTANSSRGGFHNDIKYNLQTYQAGGPRNHFEFNYKLVIAEKNAAYKRDGNQFHLNYEKSVQKELKKMNGVKTELFRMNYDLMWPDSRVIAIKSHVLEAGRDPKLTLNHGDMRGIQVCGIDVAKRNDSTVVTVMKVDPKPIVDVSKFGTPHDKQGLSDEEDEQNKFYNKYVIGLLELQGDFEGSTGQYSRILEFFRLFNIQKLVIDATTMGDPVYERLAVLLPNIEVTPYSFNLSSKSILYKYYLQEWTAGRIKYAGDKASQETNEYNSFVKQHLDLDRDMNGPYVVCSAPEGEGCHDDYPDSAALACMAEKMIKKESMPELEVLDNTIMPMPGATSHRLVANRQERYRYRTSGR